MAQTPGLDPPPMPKGWKLDMIRTEPDPDEIVPCIVTRRVMVKDPHRLWHWQLATMSHATLISLKRGQDIDPSDITWFGQPSDIQQSLQGYPDFDLVEKIGETFGLQVVQGFESEDVTKTRCFLRETDSIIKEVKAKIRA